jgi:hypothetical protein
VDTADTAMGGGRSWNKTPERDASGAKARLESPWLAARLKPCPVTRQGLSAACDEGATVNGARDADNDGRFPRWSGGGLGVAAARVELLRPAVEPILESHGVPADIAAAVMLVESGGRGDALSSKGARGVWQLMPDTARRHGLRVDDARDERLDLAKSTGAAAQYLHDLYARFGDWRLALAAYNAGENNVSAAILKAHSQDFDRLAGLRMLPLETRDYVPRVLAKVSFTRLAWGGGDSRKTSGVTVFALNGQ